jgi:hypothetical protein
VDGVSWCALALLREMGLHLCVLRASRIEPRLSRVPRTNRQGKNWPHRSGRESSLGRRNASRWVVDGYEADELSGLGAGAKREINCLPGAPATTSRPLCKEPASTFRERRAGVAQTSVNSSQNRRGSLLNREHSTDFPRSTVPGVVTPSGNRCPLWVSVCALSRRRSQVRVAGSSGARPAAL